jgi:glycine/sarcosine N-methyltransferase
MNTVSPEQFYDQLAAEYDEMTQFAQRLPGQRDLLAHFLPLQHAIDMGCGTGLHSIALASLGVHVVGIDISTEMLEQARGNAVNQGVTAEFINGDFFTAPPENCAPADLLLCLGNSLPHIKRNELHDLFFHWHGLLRPGGLAVIQLLNYNRVLSRGERIVNIRRSGNGTLVRFYDFLDDALRFNILTITETAGSLAHTLRASMLTPFTDDEIITVAQATGYSSVEIFASMSHEPFSIDATDCVAFLRS